MRPAATSTLSAVSCSPVSRVSSNRPSAYDARVRSAPVRTRIPSCANTSVSTADASGSLAASSRSPCWTTVTWTPNRANTCASSQPIGPPPTTTSEPGSSVTWTASRLVQNGVSASPSTGGVAGRVPGLSTTPLLAS